MDYVLKLYITGKTSRSEYAVRNLRAALASVLTASKYDLVVIDLIEQPEVAEREKILATPVLVRELPQPRRWIVGDLSDRDKIVRALEIEPARRPPDAAATQESQPR